MPGGIACHTTAAVDRLARQVRPHPITTPPLASRRCGSSPCPEGLALNLKETPTR